MNHFFRMDRCSRPDCPNPRPPGRPGTGLRGRRPPGPAGKAGCLAPRPGPRGRPGCLAPRPEPLWGPERPHRGPVPVAALALLGCILLSGACTQPEGQLPEKPARLVLGFPTAASRAFIPAGASVEKIRISGTGPGKARAAAEAEAADASLELELVPGTWYFDAEGLGSGDFPVARGSIELTLAPGEKKNASLVLLPLQGSGTLSLVWSVAGEMLPGDMLAGNLIPAQGESIPLSAAAEAASAGPLPLPSGPWVLELSLQREGVILAGFAESIFVAAGMETKASLIFEPPTARLALALALPEPAAPAIALSPTVRRIAPDLGAAFRSPGTAAGFWYQDGRLLPEAGPLLIIAAAAVQSSARIDRIVPAGLSAPASASARLFIREARVAGPLAWAETLVRDDGPVGDPALRALGDCRDLAFSPDGKLLAAAGKDSAALGFFEAGAAGEVFPAGGLSVASAPGFLAPSRLRFLSDDRLVLLAEASGALELVDPGTPASSLPPRLLAILADPLLAGALDFQPAPGGAPGGGELLVAGTTANALFGVKLSADGAAWDGCVRAAGAGDPGLESFSKPLALAFSPDGGSLAVGTGGDDAIYLFNRAADGLLTLRERIPSSACSALAPLSDPVALVFSPGGDSLFVLSYYGKALIRLDRSPSGSFLPVAAIRSGSAGATGFDYPKRLVLSPDGSRAIIAGGGLTDGISVIDTATPGTLSFVANILPDGSDAAPPRPAALALSPDGSILAAASGETARLVFHRVTR